MPASSLLFSSTARLVARSMAASSVSRSQGFKRHWCATDTARKASSISWWPERTMRTTLGHCSHTFFSRLAPSIWGMRKSETTTSNGVAERSSNAVSPSGAKDISQSARCGASIRCNPSNACGSSSTNKMRFIPAPIVFFGPTRPVNPGRANRPPGDGTLSNA